MRVQISLGLCFSRRKHCCSPVGTLDVELLAVSVQQAVFAFEEENVGRCSSSIRCEPRKGVLQPREDSAHCSGARRAYGRLVAHNPTSRRRAPENELRRVPARYCLQPVASLALARRCDGAVRGTAVSAPRSARVLCSARLASSHVALAYLTNTVIYIYTRMRARGVHVRRSDSPTRPGDVASQPWTVTRANTG